MQHLIRMFVSAINHRMDTLDRKEQLLAYFRGNHIAMHHVMRNTDGWHCDVVDAARTVKTEIGDHHGQLQGSSHR